MTPYLYYIGIDVSNATFDAAVFTSISEPRGDLGNFENDEAGIKSFRQRLNTESITISNAIFCVESTGVYSELICYQLHKLGYHVCLETPLKVKRAFAIKAHKTDTIDARQIAEYAFRYCDRMVRWNPKPTLINYLDTWLVLREQLVKQRTALKNLNQALHKKVEALPKALQICQELIEYLDQKLEEIENQISALIQQDDLLAHQIEIIDSIPGIGQLTALNLVTMMHQHPQLIQYTKAAAYIGICPYTFESGTSVRKSARISHLGPPRIRKLLHLCARSACTHVDPFKTYYQRKLSQGKAKKLVINNVANKLLRIACALINSNKPYIENYVSFRPKLS